MAGMTKLWGFQPVIVRRNDRATRADHFPQKSERYEVATEVEQAPQPIPQTSFYGVGRDVAHATPHQWRYTALAIPEWLSVIGWPFGVAKVPSALVVSMPRGRHNPVRERTNITAPQSTSLGSITAVQGVSAFQPNLAKITF